MAKISKQKVKSYLDHDGKELVDLMKEKIENKDKWTDFKESLIGSIIEYSSNPTFEERQKLQDMVEGYYLSNRSWARNALDMILSDLEIKEVTNSTEKDGKDKNSDPNSIAYRRKVFESLGIECPDDIIAQARKKWQDIQDKKYGIIRKTKQTKKTEEPKSKRTSEEKSEEDNKPKEDGKIVKAIKKTYFKITASVIMAPGEVPPEILAENRDMLNAASVKLDKMAQDVKRARNIVINQNKSSLENIPEDIKNIYDQMVNEELDENELDNFAETLNKVSDEKVDDMRDAFGKFDESSRKALEAKLRTLVETKFTGIEGKELEDEIEYAVLDSKIDKEGKLVLPPRSIFKELFDEKEGETIDPEGVEVSKMLSTYLSEPKVEDLSRTELIKLGRDFRDLTKMNPKSREYAIAKRLQDHPELLPDDYSDIMDNIDTASKEQIALERISQETELRHKVIVIEDIQSQFIDIKDIIAKYDEKEASDGKLVKGDKKRRSTVLKIARGKVKSLERAGLSSVIEDGNKKSKGLLRRAKDILMPQLENARDKGTKILKKEQEQPEQGE